MTPSLGSYLAGWIALIAIAASLGAGAFHLRRWIVPDFSGALARLAELTLGISLLIVTLELLGSLSLLHYGWVVAGCVAVGLGAALLGRARAPRDADARPVAPPPVHWLALLIAVGVVSFSFAEWTFPSQLALDRGMFGGDTTWYHMPFSARFAQDHSIVDLHLTDPLRLTAWFYPQSFELLNGTWIVLFKSDFLAPLMNLAWLAFGFLAAWCIGRPYGVAPATTIAAALVFGSGVMLQTQAGEGRNDIMAFSLLVAMAAFILNGHQLRAGRDPEGETERRGPLIDNGPLILAGLAGGLAVSVRLPMLAPVGALALGVLFFRAPRAKLATLGVLGGSMAVTGAYWYVRNLIHSGNPLPLIHGIGPINLPHPEQMDLYPRPPNSVAHYLFDPPIYRAWFFPQLDNALGPLWALLLVVGLAGALYVLIRARNRMLRMVAGAALITAAVYVVTPLTAAGQQDAPTGFFTNTRYLMPGLILALMLVAVARPLREDEERRWWVLGLFTLAYAITVLTTPQWLPRYIAGTVFLTLVLVWAPAGLGYLRVQGMSRAAVAGAAAAVLLAVVVLGRAQEVQFAEHRYSEPELFLQEGGPVEAFDWARQQHDKRIAIAGSGELFFAQFGFYGADLSNRVQYVGVPGSHGQYRLPTSCPQFRRLINRGDYDYLAVTQYGTDEEDKFDFPMRAWVKDDPALEEIIDELLITPQKDWVYRIDGPLHPEQCGASGRS
jgi:hypothetical protein